MSQIEETIKIEDQETSVTQDKTFLNFDDFSSFYDKFSVKIKETVASSSKIPLNETDLEYFSNIPSFQTFMQSQNERILKLMGLILKNQNVKKSNFTSSKLDNEERMELLTDINDQLIEKLGIQLDEIQGLRKKTETELKLSATSLNLTSRNINTSWNKDAGMVVNKELAKNLQQTSNRQTSSSGIEFRQFSGQKGFIQKPQVLFKDKIDNSNLPFLPKITYKPNALQPLPDIFTKIYQNDFQITHEVFQENIELLQNPYAHEIEQLTLTEEDLNELDETKLEIINIDQAGYKFIETLDELKWLCDYLGKANRSKIKEIAVDLEHHSYRSFLGFTCLMQISTRDQDFLIDTIKLRAEMHLLNEIFTDWTLLKVLHGADFDIEWLQKDFGIYVVNMFDTGQAARHLLYPHFSLSYLLQKFCNVAAQKQYQLADWRIRPLNEGMIKYAREDTRYLLYIYDRMKNELLNQSNNREICQTGLYQVMEKSKAICKKVYKKPVFYSRGFLTLCQNNSHLNPKQMKALQDLYKWRDKLAREHDESCDFVLKNHQLLKIAELLPREIYGILALCNPISPIVETNVHEIHEIVKKSREFNGTIASLDLGQVEQENTSTLDVQKSKLIDSIVHSVTYDPESILNCPHDFPHQTQKIDSMETETIQDANAIETASKSSLSDLLIPPVSLVNELPNDFVKNEKISLDKFFEKKMASDKLDKRLKKIEEKVNEIKKKIKSPFEMFLPKYYQIGHNIELGQYWNLIKSSENKQVKETEDVVESVAETKPEDISMIPLKKQFKLEKNTEMKKLKKKLKDVDFSDAIIEYNKMKSEKIEALGSEDLDNSDENFNKLSQKVTENLKSISQNVKKANFSKAFQEASEFKYDTTSMNEMFSKPKNDNQDQKVKRFEDKFGKVNKRRATNAVTRSKNNKSLTFKKPN